MMAMRGYKRRGRPPKTPHAAPRFLNAKFNNIEKPKWLHGRCKPENQSTTSATDTPQSKYRPTAFTPRPRGRPRKIKPPISARSQERDSEYHYGSDFLSGSDSDSNLDDKRSSAVETDVDFETSSLPDGDSWSQDVAAELTTKGPTPLPVWLEERSLPPLTLPESSQDLLLPAQHLLAACGIYEVLRRFSNLLRLSPFRYEDFLAALRSEEYSFLIGEVHLVLLKSLLREEDIQQTSFGPLDLKDSVNSVLQFSDYFTWPAVLKAYLQSDPNFIAPLQTLESCEYPFTSIENKLSLLKFLIDMVLLTTPIREDLVREGQTRYEDHCRSCHRMGDLLCCETCPAVYHLECVEPALTDVPNGDWLCPTCTLQQVNGVTDCVSELEKSGLASRLECLGFDRNGHKYWFVCRRIFVESEDGNVLYYSTRAAFEELLAALDPEELEASLCREIFLHREDILEQMTITESVTAELKGDKTSYLEKYDARIAELVSQKNAIVDTKAGQEEQVETTDLSEAIVGATEAKVLQNNHVSANGTGQASILEDEPLFRLGEEGTYKNYTNIYTTNTLALNKFQHAEERDRKRYLSHKFSLTPAAEFKWTTSLYGPKSSFLQALRTSLLALRDSLHSAFMHTNWHVVRKAWTVAVNNASTPRDFSRTLAVLAMCIRPVACNALWFDSLGHVRFHRQTAHERENKKKLDKKEKKEKDMEEEMFRVHTVHYTLGVKHQLWKMKGEEFRSHGQWGWLWVSATRPIKRINVDNMGLLRLAKVLKAETDATSEIESADVDVSTDQDPFRDVVDVSQAFNDPARKVYAKVAKTRKLDALLAWRLRQGEMGKKVPAVKIEPPELPDEKPKDLCGFPYPCYVFECGTGCYSPICSQRQMQRSFKVNGKLEDVKDSKAIGVDSAANTSEKYALQKLPTVKGKTAVRVPVAYPRTSSFVTRSAKRGLFVLEANELRRLARKRGQISVSGFISTAKANPSAWPYPCCRPAFRTCWLYRTSSARSLADLALQLRIFWACLRWDDMQAKPPTVDGKNQVTTDTEITTTEILKHRTTGRFLDKTQYFCRRVVIPLELPKTVREVTPSRFGLRKRKRVESPRLSEPLVSEDWVDENKLELWDIKQYYERNEKAVANAAMKKTNAMTNLFAGGKGSAEQLSKLGVKQGSTVKVDRSKISQLPNSSRVEISGKTYLRFTIPGGKVALQAASGGLPVTKNTLATLLASTQKAGGAATGGLKQLAISKPQVEIQKKPQQATPVKPNQVTVIRMPGANTTGMQQKLHVSRALDGKFLVRGLLPGQRLVQLSDGKFQLIGTPTVHKTPVADGKTASPNVTTTKIVTKQPSTVTVNRTSLSGNQVVPNTEGQIAKPVQVANKSNAAAGELNTSSVEETKEAVSTGKMEVKIISDAGEASTPAVSEKPTALLVQTTQGPRIILQGLQGNSLSAQEVQAIQEQVKSQLLKAQQLKQQADKGAKLPDTPLQIKIGIPAQRPSPIVPEKSNVASEASETCGTNSSENEFVVTRDFIQQTIRKALKQENLNPDVEHKLLQLQRYQEKQKATTGSNVVPSNHKKKRVEESTDSESVASTPRGGSRVSLHDSSAMGKPVMEEPVRVQRTVAKTIDRKQVMGEKLMSLMMRHADNLRRAMLKYRDNLDRTLQSQTQAELRVATSEHYAMSPVSSPKLEIAIARDSIAQERLSPAERVSSPQLSKSSTKRRRTSAKDKDLTNRKNLHCVCKTPYDSSKFYVGCDICLNWFHGECIGISEAMSRTMTEYVCADCTKSKETKEIFCLCRQPYNESQFYICCDRCQDWFHGHCVGIVQAEADMIDEYVCPNCQPDSTLNNANLRLLAEKDYEHIAEVVRSLLKNRNSWPFREAVNPHTVPNYYEVIKDPVDLAKILRRLSTRQYRRLAEVVGDITKMFENCRYFNSNDSSIYKCAEALESYFVPRLHNIRKILTDS